MGRREGGEEIIRERNKIPAGVKLTNNTQLSLTHSTHQHTLNTHSAHTQHTFNTPAHTQHTLNTHIKVIL